jgi:transposase-like protein
MTKSATKDETKEVGTLAQLVLPLAELVRGDLRELVTSIGLKAIAALIEQERTGLCGPAYERNPTRTATRGGSVQSELTYGGSKVKMRRPRVVDREGHEVPLDVWSELSSNDALSERVLEQMTIGVATRKYARSLESVPEDVETSATSKRAVTRQFVATTAAKLKEWMARPLGEIDLVAIFIDGIHFGEHVVIAALGVDLKGNKHVLGLHEGATENGPACRALLADLTTRGVPTDRTILFVCAAWQWCSRRNRYCSAVSTPSATTPSLSRCAIARIACTIATSSGSSGISRTKERSILMRCSGRRLRWDRLEYPVPKSSKAS